MVRFGCVTFFVAVWSWGGSLENALTLLTGYFLNGDYVLGEKHLQRHKETSIRILRLGIEITAVFWSSQRFDALLGFVKSDYLFLREAFKD